MPRALVYCLVLVVSAAANVSAAPKSIKHDAEYYILYEQNGGRWELEGKELDQKLAKPPLDLKKLPFDPLEYIEYELPYDGIDPGLGQ
jgi:hypothetical protein